MAKPHIHAKSSATKFGGEPSDYLAIHQLLDSSRSTIGDLRHRALTHNTWFITTILPKIFGDTIKNSNGKEIDVVKIGEHHVYEDYGNRFIPNAGDFLQEIEFQDWMSFMGGKEEFPPSCKKIKKRVDLLELEGDMNEDNLPSDPEESTSPDSVDSEDTPFGRPRGCGGGSVTGEMVFD